MAANKKSKKVKSTKKVGIAMPKYQVVWMADQKDNFSASGDTILHALESLPLDPITDIILDGALRVSDGKKQYEKFYPARQLKITLAQEVNRVYLAEQLGQLLEAEGVEIKK